MNNDKDDDKQEITREIGGDSRRIIYEISQKITTFQEATLVREIRDLGLLAGSARKILRTAGWRDISNGPFERPAGFLRGQWRVNAMCVFPQCQKPFLLVHDTEEFLEELVALKSLARTDDDQLRPGAGE